ncbi:Uncharacterized protein dnm_082980 [Desulfonema magnum]|uniref:Uncharacterized protein n=1 Tax=Desulfonema magnum TaxID=45655 RepID=A0A975BVF2_9BACT|nr:Uncharacterized protein dnm_082980 [Desulfonema magnum]
MQGKLETEEKKQGDLKPKSKKTQRKELNIERSFKKSNLSLYRIRPEHCRRSSFN